MENKKTQSVTSTVPKAEPIIAPDVTQIEPAVATIVNASFVPQKVRVGIYSVAGSVGLVAGPVGLAIGGQVGIVLEAIGAGCIALVGGTALSHIGK